MGIFLQLILVFNVCMKSESILYMNMNSLIILCIIALLNFPFVCVPIYN